MLKRFLLFSGYNYYPGGGWDDFVGSFDAIDEAITKADRANDKWWHIVDTESGAVILHDADNRYPVTG